MRASSCIRVLAPSFALAALCGSLQAQALIEFPVPTPGSRPYTIVAGPDGNMWFTESNGNKIGRITPEGAILEFPVPTAGSGPYGIAVGPDRNIWFTERFADKIGRLVPSTGVITEFPIPTAFAQPWEIVAGADGRMWFTEEDVGKIGAISMTGQIQELSSIGCCFPTGIANGPGGNIWYTLEINDQIGRIAPGNQVTQFQIQSVQVLPWDIAPGPDGNMWFTELAGRAVGKITPTGVITEYPVPGQFSGIAGIAAGADGNLWFTENDTHQISGMTTAGAMLTTIATSDRPLSVCLGPDGNIWFTVADGNKIGRLSVAVDSRRYVLATDFGFVPEVRTARLGKIVQWTFMGPSQHLVRDGSGLQLFNSGLQSQVSYYSYTYVAAGAYVVGDTAPFTRGAINVPVTVPPAGNVGVPFQVTWADPAVPAGHVEDLLILVPGAPDYVPWMSSSASSASYTPTTPGNYSFRGRLRNTTTGQASFDSRPSTIRVL